MRMCSIFFPRGTEILWKEREMMEGICLRTQRPHTHTHVDIPSIDPALLCSSFLKVGHALNVIHSPGLSGKGN